MENVLVDSLLAKYKEELENSSLDLEKSSEAYQSTVPGSTRATYLYSRLTGIEAKIEVLEEIINDLSIVSSQQNEV